MSSEKFPYLEAGWRRGAGVSAHSGYCNKPIIRFVVTYKQQHLLLIFLEAERRPSSWHQQTLLSLPSRWISSCCNLTWCKEQGSHLGTLTVKGLISSLTDLITCQGFNLLILSQRASSFKIVIWRGQTYSWQLLKEKRGVYKKVRDHNDIKVPMWISRTRYKDKGESLFSTRFYLGILKWDSEILPSLELHAWKMVSYSRSKAQKM